MKALTVDDVLYFWSCSVLGVPRRVRPKTLDKRSFDDRSLAANIGQCTRAVESIPGYNKELVLAWVDARGLSDDDFARWTDFESELIRSLTANPMFAFYDDVGSERPPRPSFSLDEAARKLNMTRNALSVKLHRMPTSLPYGSCKTSEGWKIYEEDLPSLGLDRRSKSPSVAHSNN